MSIHEKVKYNIKVEVPSHEDDRQRMEILEKTCEILRKELAIEKQTVANLMKESSERHEHVKKMRALLDTYPDQNLSAGDDSTLRTEHDLAASEQKREEKTRKKSLKRKRSSSQEGGSNPYCGENVEYKTCAKCHTEMPKKNFKTNNGRYVVFRKMCRRCKYQHDHNKRTSSV